LLLYNYVALPYKGSFSFSIFVSGMHTVVELPLLKVLVNK